MSISTLLEKLNAAGPEPSMLATSLVAIRLGDILNPQHVQKTAPVSAVWNLGQLGLPPARIGGFVRALAGDLAGVSPAVFQMSGTFATILPPEGIVIGTGKSAVRVVPKAGYSVRYAQFNPGSKAPAGAFYLASQGLKVYVTGQGSVWEVWTQLGNDASIVLTSKSADVQKSVALATAQAGCFSIIDGNGDDGTGLAVESPDVSAATRSIYGAVPAPGSLTLSRDGNLLFLPQAATKLDLQYSAAPAVSLENLYPGNF